MPMHIEFDLTRERGRNRLMPVSGLFDHDTVSIIVTENVSSGYAWHPHQLPGGVSVLEHSRQERKPRDGLIGASCTVRVNFEILDASRLGRVELRCMRPWVGAHPDDRTVVLDLCL